MKKILYLSDVSLDNVGGAQESMKIILNGLKNEFHFTMITPSSSKKVDNQVVISNYTDFVLKSKSKLELVKLLFRIKKEIDRIKPDIIHVQMPSTMILVSLLKKFHLLSSRIKLVYTDRGVYVKYGRLTKESIKSLTGHLSYLVTTTNNNYSNYMKEDVIEDKNKLVVIPNTAGELFDTYEPEKRTKIRSEHQIADNEIVIGLSGRYTVEKNWPMAIELIEELNKKYKDIFKVVLTIGTNKTDEQIQQVKELIQTVENTIGKDRLISYIDVPIEKMNEIFYLSDIFILTSRQESFGRTAVEAMARKNVVYGTRIDGLEEVIHFEENKYSTIDEIVEKIEADILSENNLDEEKNKFYQRYLNNYNTDTCLNNYRKLYNNL